MAPAAPDNDKPGAVSSVQRPGGPWVPDAAMGRVM
jgi:hypothetical protein